MKSVSVLCVLKSGGDYSFQDVLSLKRMLEKNVTVPYKFVCLTDMGKSKDFDTIPLKHDYSGWWSKIELFRYGLVTTDRIIYFDLDTVIISNIDDLFFQDVPFIGLLPFNPRRMLLEGYVASGILGWENDSTFNFIYNAFNYSSHLPYFKGDQDYISFILGEQNIEPNYWQNLVKGIYSYKRHLRGKENLEGVRIACFHGKPRPKLVADVWVKNAIV